MFPPSSASLEKDEGLKHLPQGGRKVRSGSIHANQQLRTASLLGDGNSTHLAAGRRRPLATDDGDGSRAAGASTGF